MKGYIGIDVGSVTTKVVFLNENKEICWNIYLRTRGQPIITIQEALKTLEGGIGPEISVSGVGATGSGRKLAGHLIGADII